MLFLARACLALSAALTFAAAYELQLDFDFQDDDVLRDKMPVFKAEPNVVSVYDRDLVTKKPSIQSILVS